MRRYFLSFLGLLAVVASSGCGSGSHTFVSTPGSTQQQRMTFSNSSAPTITEFGRHLPRDHGPFYITQAADGNMWFTDSIDPDFGTSFLGRITPDGQITQFQYVKNSLTFPSLNGITAGPDGALWISDGGDEVIARMVVKGPNAGDFKIVAQLPSNGSFPQGITTGPDNNIWFVEDGISAVGRLSTAGSLTTFPINQNAEPLDIASGPDGNLWITESYRNRIAKMSTTGGVIEYWKGISPKAALDAITAGPDGALWFTERNAIGRITTSGAVTEYSSGISTGEHPSWIAAGADGALWFTEHGNHPGLARITTGGVITEYTNGITAGANPGGIAPGTGRTLWFTETGLDHVAKVAF